MNYRYKIAHIEYEFNVWDDAFPGEQEITWSRPSYLLGLRSHWQMENSGADPESQPQI